MNGLLIIHGKQIWCNMKTILKKSKEVRYYIRNRVSQKYLCEFAWYHYDITDKEFEKIFVWNKDIEHSINFSSKNDFEYWLKKCTSNSRRSRSQYKKNIRYFSNEEFLIKVREYILNNFELVTCEYVKTYESTKITDSTFFINCT